MVSHGDGGGEQAQDVGQLSQLEKAREGARCEPHWKVQGTAAERWELSEEEKKKSQ